jgi:hypothetical protein
MLRATEIAGHPNVWKGESQTAEPQKTLWSHRPSSGACQTEMRAVVLGQRFVLMKHACLPKPLCPRCNPAPETPFGAPAATAALLAGGTCCIDAWVCCWREETSRVSTSQNMERAGWSVGPAGRLCPPATPPPLACLSSSTLNRKPIRPLAVYQRNSLGSGQLPVDWHAATSSLACPSRRLPSRCWERHGGAGCRARVLAEVQAPAAAAAVTFVFITCRQPARSCAANDFCCRTGCRGHQGSAHTRPCCPDSQHDV